MLFNIFYSEEDRVEYAGKRVEFANGDRGTVVVTSEKSIFILIDSTDDHDCRLMAVLKDHLKPV